MLQVGSGEVKNAAHDGATGPDGSEAALVLVEEAHILVA